MSSILFEIKNAVAFITLNRPEKFNSFNREMALLMQAKLDEAASLHEVRAVYITGAGKAFCAGQDISELAPSPNSVPAEPAPPKGEEITIAKILSEHYNPIVKRIRNMPKPVIAAVNGVAAGAGANIALCCDVVVAAAAASFIQAFSKIGLIPDSGGTFTLPRLIGWQRASALMMTGDKVSATEAERMGMIFKVFENGVFEEESRNIAKNLAQMPTKGLAYTKHALNQSFCSNWEEQLAIEDKYQQKAADTEDYAEGINSFLEKRMPQFKGK